MSYNNFAFNISKSTPTTSTTNTTLPAELPGTTATVSVPDPKPNTTNSSTLNKHFHGMLTTSTGRVSPKLAVPSTSDAAPTVVTIDNELKQESTENWGSKTDLKGLFDKFDTKHEEVEEEDKFDRFRREAGLNDRRESSETGEKESLEVLEEKHGHRVASGSGERQEVGADEKEIKADKDEIKTNKEETKTNKEEIKADKEETEEKKEDEQKKKEQLIEPQTHQPQNDEDEDKTDKEDDKTDKEDDQEDDKTDRSDEKDDSIIEIEEDQDSAIEQYQLTEDEIKSHQKQTQKVHKETSQNPLRPSRSRSLSQVNINPAEQYQQSHKPFNFHVFLDHLKKKPAHPIARYIRSFLVSFNKQASNFTLQQKSKIVRDFKVFMNEKFTLFEPFKSMDDIDLENSREGLEKLIMNRIYIHCFSPEIAKHSNPQGLGLVKSDLENDVNFSAQLEKFSWVNGNHLDIDLGETVNLAEVVNLQESTVKNPSDPNQKPSEPISRQESFIDYAIKELQKINSYRAPRDKIICILNACKIIFGFLRANNQETNADAFIPILILIIIRGKIDNLISNFNYIENFRGSEWLDHGETCYYLSSLQAAINFIDNISFSDLSIEKEEFDAHMEVWAANERVKRELETTKAIPINQPKPESSNAQVLSPSQVLFTSAEMFTKSISNFLSPSPQGSPDLRTDPRTDTGAEPVAPASSADETLIKETYNQLKEIFPNMDKPIIKDIVIMNSGNMDQSLDACLQLAS